MKINLVCVGNIKDKFYADACAEYAKRLGRFCTLTVTETAECTTGGEPQGSQIRDMLKAEAEKYKKHLKGFVIAADIGGRQLSSEGFASFITAKKSEGISEITFLIGGSYGIDSEVKENCGLRLSFSPMTFPHRLFRVMLLEQIYRAFMIENNYPYHK